MIGNRIRSCKDGYPFPLKTVFPSDWPLWTGPPSLTLDLCVLTPIVVLVGSSGLQLPAVSWSKQILVTWPWPPKKQQHLQKIMHRKGFHQSKYIFSAFLILVALTMKTLKIFPILKGFFWGGGGFQYTSPISNLMTEDLLRKTYYRISRNFSESKI